MFLFRRIQNKFSSYNRFSLLFLSVLVLLIVSIAIEQWMDYLHLRNQIGKYAYSSSYALRTLGRHNQYIGKIVDVRWNSLPEHKQDIEGLQPRLLIARETTSGATERQWWCSYLFHVEDQAPKKYKPSPFPDLNMMPGAQ